MAMVYIPDKIYARLLDRAHEAQISVEALVEQVMENEVVSNITPPDPNAWEGLIGLIDDESIPTDIAENLKDYMADFWRNQTTDHDHRD